MALRNNGNMYASFGVQHFGQGVSNSALPSVLQANFAQTNRIRNLTAGEGITSELVGLPSGYRNPAAWMMPQKPGALAARNTTFITFSQAGTVYGGITADAITSFSITVADATGELISSGEGTAAFTFTVADALLSGSLAAGGSTSFTISTNTPLLGAEASVIGEVTFTINGALVPFAIGNMIGTTDVTTELTAGQVATAVWESVIEAGYTAEEVLRLLSAYAAGDASGLNGTASFTGIDGVTTRIEGTVNGVTRTITALDAS